MDPLNQEPRIKSWMSEHDIQLRQRATSTLYTAAQIGILPHPTIESLEIPSSGDDSIVFIVKSPNGPYVAKIASRPGSVQAEANFLSQWSSIGINTPKVLSLHTAGDVLPTSILCLEFIDAPLLSKLTSQQLVETGMARQIGSTLAHMHQLKGHGFGYPKPDDPDTGIYSTFTQEMESITGSKLTTLINQGILSTNDIAFVQTAVNILDNDTRNGTQPSLIHGDFRPYNIFHTSPLTVFDPHPAYSHPAMCLALTILKAETDRLFGQQEKDEILGGYRQVNPISDHVLSAALVLRGINTLHYWSKKEKIGKISKLVSIIRQHQAEIT